MRTFARSVSVLLLCLFSFAAARMWAEDEVRAGEPFSGAKGWLNTAEPLTVDKLKGQVVLVDFWTYCCINCMHVMPELKFLEEKYKDQPFVVVGVHSGKFDQEKDIDNIRAAVLRNGLTHPVAVDSDFAIWNRFGVHAWPTLVLIDSTGKPIGSVSGEGHRELLDKTIAKLLAAGREAGTLAEKPLVFAPEKAVDGPLAYPGKVVVDAPHQRLFIADTGHHRVLVAGFDGTVTMIIGNGKPALTDGTLVTASFNEPQGMAPTPDGKLLYVCDRQNHALRVVDLVAGTVRTLAGNGEQGQDRKYSGPAAKVQLNSPWDAVLVEGTLFIAMAGHHQIWRYDPAAGTIAVHAGNGSERCVNGTHATAAFAQPSGVVSDGHRLFVADSEVSSIRLVDTASDGSTTTLAGSEDLFGFGMKDGLGQEARFQHPLGVALIGNGMTQRLVVADTYNHVLRRVDPLTGQVETLAGTGKAELGTEAKIGFFEPNGISADATHLYVADTNHSRIVVLNQDGSSARVLPIVFPAPATPAEKAP